MTPTEPRSFRLVAIVVLLGPCWGCVGIVDEGDLDFETMPLAELEDLARAAESEPMEVAEAFPARTGTGVPGTTLLHVEGEAGSLHTLQLRTETIDDTNLRAGDILIPAPGSPQDLPDGWRQVQAVAAKYALRWPRGVIPYDAAGLRRESPSTTFEGMIIAAMRRWSTATSGAVRFVPRTTEEDYLRFVRRDGCASYLGRIGGRQDVWLGPRCGYEQALHELGHAIGLHHEHQRQERDQHIVIYWDNVPNDWRDQFEKIESGWASSAYDLSSIMHYPSRHYEDCTGWRALIPWCGKTWLKAKTSDGLVPIKHAKHLSSADIATVRRMYTH